MNFFNQYKDLFQVGNIGFIPSQRLRLDNELFIDRPYIPTYTQEHTLNSKLRELKKDYNQFESELRELEQLQKIPQRSHSRRKQYNAQQRPIHHKNSINQHDSQVNTNSKNQPSPSLNQQNSRNSYSYKKQQSSIFNHYQQNPLSQQQRKFSLNRQKQRSLQQHNNKSVLSTYSTQSPQLSRGKYNQQQLFQGTQKQNQEQLTHSLRNKSSSVHQQYNVSQQSSQKQYLQDLRKQSQQNTQRLIKNQNFLKNRFYNEDSNNVLKQSEINHLFNWKLQKSLDKLQNIPETTIPKYKIDNSQLEQRQRQNGSMNSKNFMIRSVSNTQMINGRNQIKNSSNNRDSRSMTATERRQIAKQKIDERRQKLKMILKSYF